MWHRGSSFICFCPEQLMKMQFGMTHYLNIQKSPCDLWSQRLGHWNILYSEVGAGGNSVPGFIEK
jgi:hypothetical protein